METVVAVFAKSLFVGMCVAVPVGPVGLFCIHRALFSNRATGLTCGLGMALADCSYAAVAAFGLTFVSHFLTGHEPWFKLTGGVFLLLLAWRMYVERAPEQEVRPTAHRLAGTLLQTYALTATNPATILAFAVIFAGLGLGTRASHASHALAATLGVFLGSFSWWLAIAFGGERLRSFFAARLERVRRSAAVIIGLFGAAALAGGAFTLLRGAPPA